jgi:chemotaxis protein CheD
MDLLAKAGFTVSAENIGGSGSRTVVFDVWSGDVWVRHVPLVEARSMEAQ